MDRNCKDYEGREVVIIQHLIDASHKDNPHKALEGHKEMFLDGKLVFDSSEATFIDECHERGTEFALWIIQEVMP